MSNSQWWPWKVCLFLLLATALSYVDRQALSVAAPRISAELSLDNAKLGLLLSAFFYSYSLMHLAVGYLLDRFPVRLTYALFVAFWSMAQMATGFAGSFAALCTGRVFLGGFEAAAQPGAARIIAAILPEKDRSMANGLMMSGGSLGAIVAPPLMIWMANTIGWRYGFTFLGGAGLIWALAWLAWFRPPAEPENAGRKMRPELTEQDRWSVVLRSPKFWSCAAGAAFAIPIIHISSAWVPTYLVQQWKLPLSAGLGAYLLFIYAGLDLGFLAGGAAVSGLIRRGFAVGHARKVVMAVSTLAMLAAVAVPFAPRAEWAVFLVFLLNLGRASYGASFLAFNQDIAPGRVGMMAGTMGCIGAFSGAQLVWAIGLISKSAGFMIPFVMVGGLAILGLLPILCVNWDGKANA